MAIVRRKQHTTPHTHTRTNNKHRIRINSFSHHRSCICLHRFERGDTSLTASSSLSVTCMSVTLVKNGLKAGFTVCLFQQSQHISFDSSSSIFVGQYVHTHRVRKSRIKPGINMGQKALYVNFLTVDFIFKQGGDRLTVVSAANSLRKHWGNAQH